MATPKIHWYYGCGWGRASSCNITAICFLADVAKQPKWFCVTCAKMALKKVK